MAMLWRNAGSFPAFQQISLLEYKAAPTCMSHCIVLLCIVSKVAPGHTLLQCLRFVPQLSGFLLPQGDSSYSKLNRLPLSVRTMSDLIFLSVFLPSFLDCFHVFSGSIVMETECAGLCVAVWKEKKKHSSVNIWTVLILSINIINNPCEFILKYDF